MGRETLSAAQERLAEAGFVEDLVADGSMLRATGSGQTFDPGDLAVVEAGRFEGESDPDGEAILFALTTSNGEPIGTYTARGPITGTEDAAIVERLHQTPLDEQDLRAHQEHDHVAAVFPSRDAAEAAVGELRGLGLGSDRLGVAVHGADHVAFERDAEAEVGYDAEVGAGAGAVVGFQAGLALVAVAVPGVGTVGVGGLLALGVATGFGGAMLGGYAGVAAGDRAFSVHEQLADAALQPDEVLVAVCSHGHPDAVENAMRRHHGRLLSGGG
jgi:hypothetical protein